ncbi:MAG: hypothetical protein N4A39_17840 [Roseicyclus sp.]|nr:hypothetical protein [Roseicyclus sp.]
MWFYDCQSAYFQRRTTELLERLAPSKLRALALDAVALYGAAWDYETGSDKGDKMNVARFFEVVEQIQRTPATAAHEAAAKAIVVTLLYESVMAPDRTASRSRKSVIVMALAGSTQQSRRPPPDQDRVQPPLHPQNLWRTLGKLVDQPR